MLRKAEKKDLEALTRLANLLWEGHNLSELMDEFSSIMAKENAAFFLQFTEEEPIGFAQCQLRHDYVEGTQSSPVGYLEGIFVKEEYRHKGYAKELLTACEDWAREKGCKEFASDCELENADSLNFHLKMGFTEANRIICFTKAL